MEHHGEDVAVARSAASRSVRKAGIGHAVVCTSRDEPTATALNPGSGQCDDALRRGARSPSRRRRSRARRGRRWCASPTRGGTAPGAPGARRRTARAARPSARSGMSRRGRRHEHLARLGLRVDLRSGRPSGRALAVTPARRRSVEQRQAGVGRGAALPSAGTSVARFRTRSGLVRVARVGGEAGPVRAPRRAARRARRSASVDHEPAVGGREGLIGHDHRGAGALRLRAPRRSLR